MATKEPTQKPPFKLKAQELKLTEQTNDYYLQPELVKCLYVDDIAAEVAALSTRQEDPEDIARILRQSMQRMMWYLSSGYSVSTPLGYFRPTAQGVFLESELNEALDRSRLELGVKYSMGEEMRQALEEADIAVTVTKAASGPQLYSVVSLLPPQPPLPQHPHPRGLRHARRRAAGQRMERDPLHATGQRRTLPAQENAHRHDGYEFRSRGSQRIHSGRGRRRRQRTRHLRVTSWQAAMYRLGRPKSPDLANRQVQTWQAAKKKNGPERVPHPLIA